jgi:hypothetical protein
MRTLPPEAREGLTRAWLEILREKHPGVTWVIVSDSQIGQGCEGVELLRAEEALSVAA